MGGSLEAFKLFNARWEKPSTQSSALTTATTTASSNTSEASTDNTSVSTPISTPETAPENGFKICVANVQDYSRQQQNNAKIQERLAELNSK
jgi:hypothetical protein